MRSIERQEMGNRFTTIVSNSSFDLMILGSSLACLLLLSFLLEPSLHADEQDQSFTYSCEVVGEDSGIKISKNLYLDWNHRSRGIMAEVDASTDKVVDDPNFFYFKSGAKITVVDGFRKIETPFYPISGYHGGSQYLRGFYLQPILETDVMTFWVNTATGDAELTELGLRVRSFRGSCRSLGLGKSFPDK